MPTFVIGLLLRRDDGVVAEVRWHRVQAADEQQARSLARRSVPPPWEIVARSASAGDRQPWLN